MPQCLTDSSSLWKMPSSHGYQGLLKFGVSLITVSFTFGKIELHFLIIASYTFCKLFYSVMILQVMYQIKLFLFLVIWKNKWIILILNISIVNCNLSVFVMWFFFTRSTKSHLLSFNIPLSFIAVQLVLK